MQDEILAKEPTATLKVYAIWFSMYPGDARAKWPGALLTDARVLHLWDEKRVVGSWFGKHPDYTSLSQGRLLWDAFLLFGPEAHWEDKPTHLISTGRTIVAAREDMRKSLLPFLKK
ncbi:MAG: hypothetical protein HYX75_03605 [Acidobacteria bacterium]|nr:hypothetical protein [Acidobacteriota bacterium]